MNIIGFVYVLAAIAMYFILYILITKLYAFLVFVKHFIDGRNTQTQIPKYGNKSIQCDHSCDKLRIRFNVKAKRWVNPKSAYFDQYCGYKLKCYFLQMVCNPASNCFKKKIPYTIAHLKAVYTRSKRLATLWKRNRILLVCRTILILFVGRRLIYKSSVKGE
jgi:hypothetical protein